MRIQTEPIDCHETAGWQVNGACPENPGPALPLHALSFRVQDIDNRSLSVERAAMTAHNCENVLAKLAVEGPFLDSDCSFDL